MKQKKPVNKKKILKISLIALASLAVAAGIFLFFMLRNSISDEEAQKLMGELIPKSVEINDIVWGKGLPVVEGAEKLSSVTGAQYREVAQDSPYRSAQELAEAIKEVYSDDYFNDTINYVAFTGTQSEETSPDGTPSMLGVMEARYITDGNGVFKADISDRALNTSARTFDTASARVVKVWFSNVYVEMDMTDSTTGKTEKQVIRLRKQKNGWRLDDPTY